MGSFMSPVSFAQHIFTILFNKALIYCIPIVFLYYTSIPESIQRVGQSQSLHLFQGGTVRMTKKKKKTLCTLQEQKYFFKKNLGAEQNWVLQSSKQCYFAIIQNIDPILHFFFFFDNSLIVRNMKYLFAI